MEETRPALQNLRGLSPHVTGSLLRQILRYRDAKMLEMMVSSLSNTGLPE